MAHWDRSKGAWRLVATAPRQEGERRRRIVRYLHEPDTSTGERRAVAAEERLRAEVAAGRADSTRRGTFGDVARSWQARGQGPRGPWAAGTRRTVAEALDGYILPALGGRPIDDITPAEIEDLYTLWGSYLAPSNVRRKHGIIRRIFATAERRGELTGANPMRRVEPGGGAARERMHIPTNDDVRALAAKAGESSDTAALFIYVAAYTAARRGSVLALRWRNVEFLDDDRALIRVERALSLDEHGRAVEKSNKGGDPYPVRVQGAIVGLLRDARKRAAETALALGQGGRLDDMYVFSRDGGRTHWSVSHPSKAFRLAARTLGLSWARDDDSDGGMTLHDLRHYGASMALRAGIPVSVVAKRMGCTIANVQRTYAHYIPSPEDERAALVMAEALG